MILKYHEYDARTDGIQTSKFWFLCRWTNQWTQNSD